MLPPTRDNSSLPPAPTCERPPAAATPAVLPNAMDIQVESLSRIEIQQLCKDNNIKANLKTDALVQLLKKHIAAGGSLQRVASTSTSATTTRMTATSRVASRTRAEGTEESKIPVRVASRRREQPESEAESEVSIPDSRMRSRSASTRLRTPVDGSVSASEKENAKNPLKRKVKDTQKRLGVGRPKTAGGDGQRKVTRAGIPSRPTRQTQSQIGKPKVETVAEEVEPDQSPPVVSPPHESQESSGEILSNLTHSDGGGLPSAESTIEPILQESQESEPLASTSSQSTDSLSTPNPDNLIVPESQIALFLDTRDTILSKLSVHEKDILSVKDDLAVQRERTDVSKQSVLDLQQELEASRVGLDAMEGRLAETEKRSVDLASKFEEIEQRLTEERTEKEDLEKQLAAERDRVKGLEGLLEGLLSRVEKLEGDGIRSALNRNLTAKENVASDADPFIARTPKSTLSALPTTLGKRSRHDRDVPNIAESDNPVLDTPGLHGHKRLRLTELDGDAHRHTPRTPPPHFNPSQLHQLTRTAPSLYPEQVVFDPLEDFATSPQPPTSTPISPSELAPALSMLRRPKFEVFSDQDPAPGKGKGRARAALPHQDQAPVTTPYIPAYPAFTPLDQSFPQAQSTPSVSTAQTTPTGSEEWDSSMDAPLPSPGKGTMYGTELSRFEDRFIDPADFASSLWDNQMRW
ncbi:hypothetical protein BOTBODRAFT_169227 [Botryobasidium botryosum FD-172 SS1]|uniref:Uncharacterized protein n=1 Tax=Botryobasidium botryosum (strain FD-172 SS1) TaxID=930990 RepID=A0A067N8M2_BOTB1|nr:hypothetical protein BOTBODRAFT_169227 [Botryobasidium botryosum FD-172 SS1]